MIMALPKLTVPMYEVVCPSGLKVSFRPFLVKEEKLLLIAMQSDDTTDIINTAKQILENCVGKISNIDIDKLSLFDVEFLFLQLRARSIGEQINLRYKCNQQVKDAESGNTSICNHVSQYPINLLDIKPMFAAGHNKYIQLNETVGVTLKYPTFKSFRSIARKELPADEAFLFLVNCIESINDTDTVVLTKDVPAEEVIEFVNDLNHAQVEKIDDFFDTMPKIELALQFKCPKCQYEEKITVKGLDSFFV
jgi:hypothetical protein